MEVSKDIKCIECDRNFNSKEALRMHNESRHPEKITKPIINLGYKQKKMIFTYLIIFVILILVAYGGYGLFKKSAEKEVNAYTKTSVHWHAYPKVIICGKEKELPSPLGQGHLGNALLHTHSPPDNFMHIEGKVYSADEIKLGKYFEVLGIKFTENQIFDTKNGDLCNNKIGKLRMFVNDIENFELNNYVVKDKDNILIKYE